MLQAVLYCTVQYFSNTCNLKKSKLIKCEMLCLEEALIRQQAANLEKMQDMLGVLGSEHIKCKRYSRCLVPIENIAVAIYTTSV